MNKKSFRDLIPLVAICLIAAALLAVFNMVTEGPIKANAAAEAEKTRIRLLSAAASFLICIVLSSLMFKFQFIAPQSAAMDNE